MIPLHHQAIVLYQEEELPYNSVTYFHEFNGRVLNLSLAKEFYVDHIPMTSIYWPCVKIGMSSYQLSNSFITKEGAMNFIKDLLSKMENKE